MNLTVGQRLQKAREDRGISIQEAAHETRIRVSYLQELEADHPELLHSATQARGFLRLYADFLNLSYTELLELWESKPEEPLTPEMPEPEQEKKVFRFRPQWLKREQTESSGQIGEEDQKPPAEDELEQIQSDEPSPEESLNELQQYPQQAEPVQEPQLQDEEEPEENFPDTEENQEPSKDMSQEEPDSAEQSDPKSRSILANLQGLISRLLPSKKLTADDTVNEQEDEQPAPEITRTSEDIFKEIGQLMQSRRRMMELNLSDIENFTNLKRAFLISIEEGRFNDLPSTVQGRGMLNNYARFLGMEESVVMDMYGRALQLLREERQKPQRRTVKSPVSVKLNIPEKWRKILNPDLVIGGALIIGLFAFIIWGATQVFRAASGEPTDAPSISEVLQITATTEPTEIVEEPEEEIEATDIPGVAIAQSTPTIVATVNAAPLQLYIITHDRAYMEVVVDGVETFSGRVSPENVYTYSGSESINLVTGNASALEVYFNQEYLGNLGDIGEVVDIDFTLEGLITPTPLATATPTITPEIEVEDAMDAMEAMDGMMEEE